MNSHDNGFIYALTAGGKTKIGRSKSNPEKSRIPGLLTQGGYIRDECEVSYVETGDHKSVESKCHRQLAEKKIVGEWFDVTNMQALQVINKNVSEVVVLTRSQIESLETDRKKSINDFLRYFNKDLEDGYAQSILDNYGIAFVREGDGYMSINPYEEKMESFDSFFDAVIKSQIGFAKFDVEECSQEPSPLSEGMFTLCFDGAKEEAEKILEVCGGLIIKNINSTEEELYRLSVEAYENVAPRIVEKSTLMLEKGGK